MNDLKNQIYITDQLIPYLGNKRKLLPLIEKAIVHTGIKSGSFLDLFSGSTVVSRMAKSLGYRVISNDWEPYSYYTTLAYIKSNHAPDFKAFGNIENAIEHLNNLSPIKGYIALNYCPGNDEAYDTEIERMFYTQENGRRIDAIREEILTWRNDNIIDDMEESVLLAPLIFQAAYCSNTSGVFKGFHRGWGGATKTAWYRIRSKLTLKPPVFFDNHMENLAFKEDAEKLASNIECDIAYLDPPYNQHQYASNYHLLNTVALWDKPDITQQIIPAERNKSAIRKDWIDRKSLYCYKSSATDTFNKLLENIRSKYILVSYSTDGIIPVDDLFNALAEKGKLSVVTHRYKRYRVSSQRPSSRTHNIEFVAIVDTNTSSNKSDVSKVLEKINREQDIQYK